MTAPGGNIQKRANLCITTGAGTNGPRFRLPEWRAGARDPSRTRNRQALRDTRQTPRDAPRRPANRNPNENPTAPEAPRKSPQAPANRATNSTRPHCKPRPGSYIGRVARYRRTHTRGARRFVLRGAAATGSSRTNPRRTNGAARNRLRARIAARGEPCAICGRPIDYTLGYITDPKTGKRRPHPMSFVVDEIVPVSRGGDPYDPNNTRPAHWICNARRGAGDRRTGPTTLPLPQPWAI